MKMCKFRSRVRSIDDHEAEDDQEENITHLCIHRTTRRADGLIDIGVHHNDHAEVRIKWLPDSGSDVNAITLTDLNNIDPDLIWNLARDTQKARSVQRTARVSVQEEQ